VSIRSDDNIIGTDGDGLNDKAERNIVSANAGDGIAVAGTGNVVSGNYIGTDTSATRGLGNQRYGVSVANAGPLNRIGSDGSDAGAADEGNLISANGDFGIALGGVSVGTQVVAGNLIGVDANGLPLCNAQGGIISFTPLARIGGSPAMANTIMFNGLGFDSAVLVFVAGDSIRANVIESAVFFPNSGIEFAGGNDIQNAPVLSKAVTGSTTRIIGAFSGTPNLAFTLDFYANDPDRGSAGSYGQGQYYLGSASVTTDGSGNVNFNVAGLAGTSPGEWVTATATGADGTTSEFGQDVQASRVASVTTLTASASTPLAVGWR
jgi:hypothetical protein